MGGGNERICKLCNDREAAPQKTICYTCKSRNYTKKYPIRRVWLDLRSSAKKRSYPFLLTYEQFEKWILTTNYMTARGREKDSLTIDRINGDAKIGYTIDNIQILTKHDNSCKYWEVEYEPIECPF